MSFQRRCFLRALAAALLFLLPPHLFPQQYPVTADKVVMFDSLSIVFGRVSIQGERGSMALIECEPGVTGIVILARGSFTFISSDPQSVQGTFTNGMVRFHPSNYAKFVVTWGTKHAAQTGVPDEARLVLQRSFLRLYHKGTDALIPPGDVLGAVLLSDKMGDLIVVEGGEKTGVFSITGRKVLVDGSAASAIPSFQAISKNWHPAVNRQPMDGIWQREGIAASGNNYFYLPSAAEGRTSSRRFDPASEYFQSWFGMYVLKGGDAVMFGGAGAKPDVRAVLSLAIADQRAWLKNFAGVETPEVSTDESVPISCEPAKIAGMEGWKISARLLSNVDVGEKNPGSGRPGLFLVEPAVWEASVRSYAPAALETVTYVFRNAAGNETYLIYYNGIEFVDKNGIKHRTLPEIQKELETMAESLKFSAK